MASFRCIAVACGAALLAAVGPVIAQVMPPQTASGATEKRIIVVPPLQWDSAIGSFRTVYHQVPRDLGRLTDGILFGMDPQEVNRLLPMPLRGIAWSTLPLAPEFPEDVRYFWLKLADLGVLDAGVTACTGEGSYLVFLFRNRGLFRLSYRLLPDQACPSVSDAAQTILARYAGLAANVAISMHYRNGSAEVVDVVDPAAGYLIPLRWQVRGR